MSSALKMRVFNSIHDTGSLTLEWEALCYKNSVVPVFIHPLWSSRWLRNLGGGSKPVVTTAWNGDRLVGVFPLRLKDSLFVRRLEFIGSDDGDYLDFPLDPACRKTSLEKFIDSLEESKGTWDVCDLKDIPEESLNYLCLCEILKKRGWKAISYDTWNCSYLTIEEGWECIMKRHSRKFRYNIKRERRLLQALGRVEYKTVQSREDLEYYLPHVFAIHQRRWKGYFIASKFSTPDGRKFYTEIAREYLTRDMLRLDLLLLDGTVIAFSYSFQWKGRYLYYTPAYDPDYGKYAPGKILLMLIMETAHESGITELDFSKGDLGYKSHWRTGSRQNRRVVFASPTVKGRVAFKFYLIYISLYARVRTMKLPRIVLGRIRNLGVVLK